MDLNVCDIKSKKFLYNGVNVIPLKKKSEHQHMKTEIPLYSIILYILIYFCI